MKLGFRLYFLLVSGMLSLQANSAPEATSEANISFRLDVMPIITRSGCNTGACHGAAQGKDGFRLSLFGFDPESDYFRLTQEMPGRRVQWAVPEESLMLQKALGLVQHSGGNVIFKDSYAYITFLKWLQHGAKDDSPQTPTAKSLSIEPPTLILHGAQQTSTVRVWAHLSNGSQRDVTQQVRWTSSDEQIARISPQAVVTSGDSGESLLMARYTTASAGCAVLVVPDGVATPNYGQPQNKIDQLVVEKLKVLKIPLSPICSDETFLRRVYIDLAGRQASEEEWHQFQSWPVDERRAKIVDLLLQGEAFSRLWVMKWSELLVMDSEDKQKMSTKAVQLYGDWLRQAFFEDRPWDLMVRQLLTGTGGTFECPQTNYFRQETDPLKMAENMTQVFMGTRIQCAQCHNHPFDRWTMDDYYGFAAFMGRVGVKNGRDPREKIVFDKNNGEVVHPIGGQPVAPRYLGGAQPELKATERREKLAQWLTAPDNPWFARNMANMIWAWYMGRGVVEPVDDVRLSNPPANDSLLQYLAEVFVHYQFRIRPLVREICCSQTYQRSSETVVGNERDERYFSHAPVRRVRAEILLDMLSQATESLLKLPGLTRGDSATELIDGKFSNPFLKTFGRSSRLSVCSCEVVTEPNLSQALSLLNGDMVQKNLESSGLVAKLLKQFTPDQTFQQLTWRAYNRWPTMAEERYFSNAWEALSPKNESSKKELLEDLTWAMLNSREFAFVY